MTNSIKEFKKDEGGASVELSGDKLILEIRRQRMSAALMAKRTAEGQRLVETPQAGRILADIIEEDNVDGFISAIEWQIDDPSVIFNFLGPSNNSLLHIAVAVGKDDILGLLLDNVSDKIAAQNDWGDTPFHIAAKTGKSRAVEMLISRARDLRNVEILRMKNKHGNTALHEAVINCHIDVVRLLLEEDVDSVYLKNKAEKSPLYLALDTSNYDIFGTLFSLELKPSKIQGLPPVHGVIVRRDYGLLDKILNKNMELLKMTDSKGGNVLHLAAFQNDFQVFRLLQSEIPYFARQRDSNGDLPIHIASKMGHVKLIKKLHPESNLLNKQEQTILHVAAKYGRASAVEYILRHPEWMWINDKDGDGNTAFHLAAINSQPAALIMLMRDKRIDSSILNQEHFTAFDIALNCIEKEQTLRKIFAFTLLRGASSISSADRIILNPEARDKTFPIFITFPTFSENEKLPKVDQLRDDINTRLVVATLVTTVTFAAGFAVPGGFNGSDTASKHYRGMATMLDKRMFQAFAVCNTIAMFCSMTSVVGLALAHRIDAHLANIACWRATVMLSIALPTMSAAFLTGVILTVGKLPWLATTILILGYVFLLIITGASLSVFFPPFMQYFPFFWSHLRPIRPLLSWFILFLIYFLGVETCISDDSKEDKTASKTSASPPLDGGGKD
ncbi:hypothetical protein BT93_L5697 [Corymbia citriodora subsp. variegata]|uniref:PGG domain-containing protein n=1 Tax=Corymbia citriodora subsp. variegata TaxID=360336 RepID=A0A8T0CRK4_CORYI|nr:hypothetical protein BT93_L5697 [Corymbia citriodora subsp. variegata]